MTVSDEPFASVYDGPSRLGVILARGRGGFEAYAADAHSLGLFPSPRKAAAAITVTRPWVAQKPLGQALAADSAGVIFIGRPSCSSDCSPLTST